MIVGYYLPGNRAAPPPGHRAGGGTAHEEVEQGQFDPVPPERCPGGGAAKLRLFEISSLLSGAREVEQGQFSLELMTILSALTAHPSFEHYNSVQ